MSYQTANEDVDSMFRLVKNNLKPGGIFLFDCWYGPAVLTEKPEMRIKEINSDEYKIKRVAKPQLLAEENTVVVNYEVNIFDRKGNDVDSTKEKHRMRYFFLPELEFFAKDNLCKINFYYEWMTTDMPSVKSWNICFGGTLGDKTN